MWKRFLLLASPLILVSSSDKGIFHYPEIRRNETVIDDYFGNKVSDPYRWLEDLNSNDTQEFVKEQNEVTKAYIEKADARDEMRETIKKLWDYPKLGLPKKRGKNYYIYKNSGVQNQWILYKASSLEDLYKDDAKIFLDPNEFSTDGTVALRRVSWSKDGELLAYTVSESGSDWTKIHVRNVSSGLDFSEVLLHTKSPSVAWTHDNLGFFYTRYPEASKEDKLVQATKDEKVYYHRVGDPQEKDKFIFEFKDKPDWSLSIDISDEGEYILVYSYIVINEEYLYFAKVADALNTDVEKELVLTPLNQNGSSFSNVANDGPIFYFITNQGAPNYRLIGMDLNNPEQKYWTILIPEHETNVLSWGVAIDSDKILVSHTKDVLSTLELRNLKNGTLLVEYNLPSGSTIQSTEAKREQKMFYFQLATFTNPGEYYKLEFGENGEIPKEIELTKRIELNGFDSSKYETNQIFYESKDGTKVPMFIVKRKGLVPNADTPALMYGYGGFSSSTEPFFSIGFISFVLMFDGILAFPNIRGGAEYGTKWWDGGRLFNKQNVFDDFAYAAEYLIENNYTSTPKLAIEGASNGGLLVGACVNQRPDLYGAGIAEVGVMDMLRFQHFTVGSFWCGEYGCSDEEKHFHNLIKYSPLHNIKANTTYPAVLVLTADHDDRVVPSHSFKYISELQHVVGNYENQTQPLMIRIEEKAGHGHGKPVWKSIEEYVDIYSFLSKSLGFKFVKQDK